MAVPDTTTFTLQDVVTEINPTTDDLVDCFADAVAGNFDSSYSGSKDELLNFRNYGASTLTSFYVTVSGSKTAYCGALVSVQMWHDGANALPIFDDAVYTNSSGTTSAAWVGYKGFNTTNGLNSITSAKITLGYINNAVVCP